MTEMESPLEDYADGLGFHFDSYFIWRLLYKRIGDALSNENTMSGCLVLGISISILHFSTSIRNEIISLFSFYKKKGMGIE